MKRFKNNLKKRLKKWLDIKEPTFNEKLGKQVEQLKKDMEFWHRTFRAFSVVPCAYCKKQMRIYPYGGAYYTIKDNQKVHAECYDTYLETVTTSGTVKDHKHTHNHPKGVETCE